jgi:hypothetical protein
LWLHFSLFGHLKGITYLEDALKRGAPAGVGDGTTSRAAVGVLAAALVAIWQATIQEVLGFAGGRAVSYVARAVLNASLASRRLPTNKTTITDSTGHVEILQ